MRQTTMTQPPATDALLEQAARGDEGARRELLDRFRAQLRRMVVARLDRRLASRIDASDVVQEALVDAAGQLDRYLAERPLTFVGWLRSLTQERVLVAHRVHLYAQRRSIAREGRPAGAIDESTEALARHLVARDTSPSNRLARQEQHARVRAALDALPARDREVLEMRYLEQLSAAEIAEALGLTEGAVKARVFRALVRMRGELEADG